MEKKYELNICGIKRQLPYINIDDKKAFASFVVLSDSELIEVAAKELLKKIGDVDIFVTAEAKGIALTHEMTRLRGLKEFIVARKSVKSYMKDVVSESLESITTKGVQNLFLDGIDAKKIKGKNICIVDDVISTGESLKALEHLVLKAGAKIVSKAAILAEGDAANRKDIIFLQKLPLFNIKDNGDYEEI